MRRLLLVLFAVGGCFWPGVAGAETGFVTTTGGVQRFTLDGSAPPVTAVAALNPIGVAVDPLRGWVYWTDVPPTVPPFPDAKIRRARYDGSRVQDVLTRLDSPASLAIDVLGGRLFWTDDALFTVERSNLDGGNKGKLATLLAPLRGISFDAVSEDLFAGYVDPRIDGLFAGQIVRISSEFGGPDPTAPVTALYDPQGTAVDSARGAVFWDDAFFLLPAAEIRRANIDGTDNQSVYIGLRRPRGLAADSFAERVYWADADAGTVGRVGYNGGGREEVVKSLVDPRFVALDLTLPGDFNLDRRVTDADYGLWRSHYGMHGDAITLLDGDGNHDGRVSPADYTLWADHRELSPAAAVAPEPAAGALLLVGATIAAWCGRRRVRGVV